MPLIAATMSDCGIRPATSAEAEFMQDYIRKSNNTAAQAAVNAARASTEATEGLNRGDSDGEDDDDSEGPSSGQVSKRNSLQLPNGVKNPQLFADEKTPTASSLLAMAQASQRPPTSSFPPQASIRRHPGQAEPTLSVPSQSPVGDVSNPLALVASTSISVRQLPQFPSIEEAVGGSSNSPHSVAAREVWRWFQDHLDALLDSVRSYRFDQFELHLRTFWFNLSGSHREIVHAPAVAGLMARADAMVYDVRFPAWRIDLVLIENHAGNSGAASFADAHADPNGFPWWPTTACQ